MQKQEPFVCNKGPGQQEDVKLKLKSWTMYSMVSLWCLLGLDHHDVF